MRQSLLLLLTLLRGLGNSMLGRKNLMLASRLLRMKLTLLLLLILLVILQIPRINRYCLIHPIFWSVKFLRGPYGPLMGR